MANEQKHRIFIVEDDRVVTLELQKRLSEKGYIIAGTAVTGSEAVEKIRKVSPDIIFMDIMLEGSMSGLEAAKEIKKTMDIPLIISTAYSDAQTIESVKQSMADGYILKPYNYTELCTLMELIAKKSNYQKEIFKKEKKYRSLFENSRDPIIIFDMEGNVHDANESFSSLFQYNIQETIGLPAFSIFKTRQEYDSLIFEMTNRHGIIDREIDLISSQRSQIHCLVNASLIDENIYHFSGFQMIIRDISDQLEAQQRVQDTMERLRSAIDGIINVVALTIEARDPYTSGHQERVSVIAGKIAEKMGLTLEKKEAIVIAGRIHDIGKISVPAEILSKPGKLSVPEFNLIKMHPETGYNIIKDVEFPWDIAEIIYQHHERLDGSGYPRGLQKNEILIESQIITVADVLEAMASHRPYRPAIGLERSLNELQKMSGVWYNAEVVSICAELIKENEINNLLFE